VELCTSNSVPTRIATFDRVLLCIPDKRGALHVQTGVPGVIRMARVNASLILCTFNQLHRWHSSIIGHGSTTHPGKRGAAGPGSATAARPLQVSFVYTQNILVCTRRSDQTDFKTVLYLAICSSAATASASTPGGFNSILARRLIAGDSSISLSPC
jgi:hypothetical protein